jgi:hypothetical protein
MMGVGAIATIAIADFLWLTQFSVLFPYGIQMLVLAMNKPGEMAAQSVCNNPTCQVIGMSVVTGIITSLIVVFVIQWLFFSRKPDQTIHIKHPDKTQPQQQS